MSDQSLHLRIRSGLRDQLMSHVDDRNLDDKGFADMVGISEVGARQLRRRHDWSLERCADIAARLGVEIEVSVKVPQ